MKKFRGLHILLALALMFQLTLTPAAATEAEQAQETMAESAASSEPDASDETGESSETGESAATEETYAIPENVSGDASVNSGCNSINANMPLIDSNDLPLEEAKAALMYELNSGTLLYTNNADEKMYPASTTKIMTCLIALEQGNLDEVLTVSESVVANRDPDGSNANLIAGEEMTMRDLIYCLMVASANDAGSLISEHIAGSEEAFVELMNQKAAELGCSNTHFANPHGLHDENHYTTARDLAKIMMAALEYDFFQEVYSTKVYTVPATNKSEERRLLSTNYMIEKSQVDHYYDERVIGGKTGFTTPAGRCLVAVSEVDDMKLLTVVLGGEAGLNEYNVVTYGSFEETGNLIDYGFNNFTTGQVLSSDAVLESFAVSGGANDTQAVVKESVSTVIPSDMPQSQLRYEYVLDHGTLTAPIEAGEPLGVVRVWYQAKCLAQKEIYASISSPVKQTIIANDPAVENAAAEEENDIWHIVLIMILVLMVLIVAMLVISGIRNSIIRARRKRRRNRMGTNARNTRSARNTGTNRNRRER